MGEIRIVGPGKTRGYPYPICKKNQYNSKADKFAPSGNRIFHLLEWIQLPGE